MTLLRKKRPLTQCDREKMLRYLNRFKLKKKQIKYKPRTYANLQGINSLRSQNAINVEPPRPVIKESVKARLDCNLNALLQLDNEKNLNNNNNRRIKPQESYINMELNGSRKHPKQKKQQKKGELELQQEQLSETVHSEFALEPLDSDYRSDFEVCFENHTESLLNLHRNHRRPDGKELPKRFKGQRKNNDEFNNITPLLTNNELNILPKQKRNRKKVFAPSNCTGKEITHNFGDIFERSDDSFRFNHSEVLLLDSKPSFNERFQSEQTKQKEFQRKDDKFPKENDCQDEWDSSMPLKSQFVFPDPPNKFPSIIHSNDRFNRNHNEKVTNNTRANLMPDKIFYEKSFNKSSLRSKKTAPQTNQRNDETINSSFQSQPFKRNQNYAFVNSPSTIYSFVGSEYVESWDTIRNDVKAGHGNEPPTLPGIPDRVFFNQPIHYERSASESLWNFSGSNALSGLSKFAQNVSVSKCAQNGRPSVLTAHFTRTVIRGGNIMHIEIIS